MGFTQSFRMERAYFERLKSLIPLLKAFLETEGSEETRTMLENEITADGSILLLYRNLGEAWAELADLIEKLKNALAEEHELVEQYHDELNEKIDEVNNYIMIIIRELEQKIIELDEKKQDKETEPMQYTVQNFSYDLRTDITADDQEDILYNNNYGFYIRNVRFRSDEHLRDTPAAITLKEAAIGTDALADYLQPIKAFMNLNKIKGIEILSRTSLVVVGAAYLMYEVTNNATIYNRPQVGNQTSGADSGGIYLHTEPLKETFVDCSKFQGTQYYIFKRVSINLIPESDSTSSTNMPSLATDYVFVVPRFDQVSWAEHQIIES